MLELSRTFLTENAALPGTGVWVVCFGAGKMSPEINLIVFKRK